MPRWLTFLVASMFLMVLLPLMLAIAVLLLASGTRKIFYLDERVGRYGEIFTIYKFRTMRDAANNQQAGGYDRRRVTRLGSVLRKYRLDELPQLINVLKGDLNLVGLRPPLPSYVANDPETYRKLLSIRPGLTGLASVRFHRCEDDLMLNAAGPVEAARLHGQICIPAKARLDRFYLSRRATSVDLWILVQTLSVFLPGLRRHCRWDDSSRVLALVDRAA